LCSIRAGLTETANQELKQRRTIHTHKRILWVTTLGGLMRGRPALPPL
jgi:hypothetical protein